MSGKKRHFHYDQVYDQLWTQKRVYEVRVCTMRVNYECGTSVNYECVVRVCDTSVCGTSVVRVCVYECELRV